VFQKRSDFTGYAVLPNYASMITERIRVPTELVNVQKNCR